MTEIIDTNLINEAVKIDGWMSHDELNWLNLITNNLKVLEIGAWKGRSTKAMCSAKSIDVIDHWRGDDSIKKIKSEEEIIQSYFKFYVNLVKEIKEEKVIPHNVNILEINKVEGILGEKKFDFIFIDCDHSFEVTEHCIKLTYDYLKPCGIMAGHDYYEGEPGVVSAVNMSCLNTICRGPGSIWYSFKTFKKI